MSAAARARRRFAAATLVVAFAALAACSDVIGLGDSATLSAIPVGAGGGAGNAGTAGEGGQGAGPSCGLPDHPNPGCQECLATKCCGW